MCVAAMSEAEKLEADERLHGVFARCGFLKWIDGRIIQSWVGSPTRYRSGFNSCVSGDVRRFSAIKTNQILDISCSVHSGHTRKSNYAVSMSLGLSSDPTVFSYSCECATAR